MVFFSDSFMGLYLHRLVHIQIIVNKFLIAHAYTFETLREYFQSYEIQ